MSGLDDLVADAMKRKLVPLPEAATEAATEAAPEPKNAPPPGVPPVPEKLRTPDVKAEPKLNSEGGITPDVSLVFMVNGVRCILTVHVQAGAKVEIATEPAKKAPRSGPKVKGIRGATSEEPDAPEASTEVFDQSQPIGKDNLPEGLVYDEVVGATLPDWQEESRRVLGSKAIAEVGWLCPDHGKREERLSKVTGRYFTVCPECGKLAPK